MPITPSQLSSILRVKKEFSLITGAITLTDLTPWAGYGIIAPDTAAVLLKLVAPTGVDVYINAGYDTDDFSAPDFDLSTSTLAKTMPTDVNGDYLTGTYTLYMKAQVVEITSNGAIALNTTTPPSVGVSQVTYANVTGTSIAGDVYSIEYDGEVITYTVVGGDTNANIATGLTTNIALYQIANPGSSWTTDLTVLAVSNSVEVTAVATNTPFALTVNYIPISPPEYVYATVESTAEVCNCTATVTIDIDVDYATAVLTSTDTTSYGAYSSISRTHTIYPPPISGLPNQTTSATTNVYSNIVTTTWSVKITSNVTYLKANDTYTTCQLIGTKEVVVEADTLCATLCLIKKFRTDFYAKYGKKCVDDMEKAYNLAMDEFFLAWMATRCGRPQSEIQAYINKIYDITGIDPDCDCGCSASDYPTPVVPTSIINGTDGTDGVTPQFQNTGTWIQVSYDEGNTWSNLFSLASVTGAAGANGTNGTDGADGVAVLENLLTNSATAGTAWETLKSYTIPAGQLSTNKDFVHIRAKFRSAGTIQGQGYRIQFNGSTLFTDTFTGTKAHSLVDIYINRNAQTTGRYDGQVFLGIDAFSLSLIYASLVLPLTDIAGLDWDANPYTITCQGDSVVAGDVVCQELQVTYFHKS